MPSRDLTVAGVVGCVVLAVDQASKTLAGGLTGPGRTGLVLPVRNPGLSLQVVQAGRWAEVAVMAATLAVAAAVLGRALARSRVPAWAAGAVLGGSAANLLDRARYGSVRDFLVVGRWAVINLADVAVIVGVVACVSVAARTRPALRASEGR